MQTGVRLNCMLSAMIGAGALISVASLMVGCARPQAAASRHPELPPVARGDQPVSIAPLSGADQPGNLEPQGRRDISTPAANPPPVAVQPPVLSKTVEENVKLPGGETAPTTTPASAPAGASARAMPTTSSGEYLTLGGVVMEVNGTPIYADQVLHLVEPALKPRAKDLSPSRFRDLAERQIGEAVNALRDLQLEYAAAERNLDEKDKTMADALTREWRERQVNAAGGSEQVARSKFASRGQNFDELLQMTYRDWMRKIYYDKRIMPRVQVSARDIRDYYDQNIAREFTEPESVRFRLIKIDWSKSGGRDAAQRRIEELRNRITKAGESFEAIARSANDDPRWLASGGDLGAPIQRGAFAIEPVEKAVWATPPGQVTPVVETSGAFYLAQVESKTDAKVESFDDEAVQKRINDLLTTREFNKMRDQVQQLLLKDAAVHTDREMLSIPLDMVMQNYPKWAGKS